MSQLDLKPGFEEVFTVLEYYDGPRTGIANFSGKPHFYDCIWDEARNNYSNRFRLTLIPDHIFDLALEDWSIGERWRSAFRAGETTLESHAALPKDTKRYDEILDVLAPVLRTNSATCVTRIGSFEHVSVPTLFRSVVIDMQVRWIEDTA